LIVINQAPPSRGGVEATATVKAREALRFARCPAAQTALCYRLAFARATALGQSVEETEPNSPAAKEVSALWDEIATAARLSGSLESLAPTRL
jgi:chromosome partitioning protein